MAEDDLQDQNIYPEDAIHVIVPRDRVQTDLNGIITDVAVIEEHLRNQDRMIADQNRRFEEFARSVKQANEEFAKEAKAIGDAGSKQLIGVYTTILGSTLVLAGWVYYWILDVATHIKAAVGQ